MLICELNLKNVTPVYACEIISEWNNRIKGECQRLIFLCFYDFGKIYIDRFTLSLVSVGIIMQINNEFHPWQEFCQFDRLQKKTDRVLITQKLSIRDNLDKNCQGPECFCKNNILLLQENVLLKDNYCKYTCYISYSSLISQEKKTVDEWCTGNPTMSERRYYLAVKNIFKKGYIKCKEFLYFFFEMILIF